MGESLFVLLLLSGLSWSSSAVSRQYHYMNLRMSRSDARSYYRERFTDLATVDTMDDVNRLINSVDAGYNGSVWIGLKRGTEKRWVWSNGEDTIAQYNDWGPGEPVSGNDCVFLNRTWLTANCSDLRGSLCIDDTGQQANHPRVQDLVTVSACQEMILGNGLHTAVTYSSLLSAMEITERLKSMELESNSKISWIKSKDGEVFHQEINHTEKCHAMFSQNQNLDILVNIYPGLSWSSSAVSRQYNYMNLRMSWSDAQNYCRERFTDLATVDTMDDVNRLINSVDAGYNGSVWIGLKRGTQKRWVWSFGDDTIAQYNDWGPGEPVSGNDCVYLNRTWLTAKCSDLRGSLCVNSRGNYGIILLDQSWSEAQTYCRQNSLDLVTIRSADQEISLVKIVIKYTHLWIGLYRDSWEWSDKWNRSFRYWAPGQPSQSAGSADCVGMSRNDSGQWAPYSCDLQQPFICYGDDKLIRKQTVRLKLSCDGNCKLNDSSLQTAVLNQVTKRLKSMELESSSKISWIKSKDGEVFHQQNNHTEKCHAMFSQIQNLDIFKSIWLQTGTGNLRQAVLDTCIK
ncbi:uncharacterized protein LOC130238516 [Danio aesculapii]|uniref:uncharacterized protein LOC130238516 n=1 Tax=Danio aesculapii TaxID=1142201 RepID=UPI0024BF3400|nr:uncharacterized protein LOC130238516 [Danio aesculapii]